MVTLSQVIISIYTLVKLKIVKKECHQFNILNLFSITLMKPNIKIIKIKKVDKELAIEKDYISREMVIMEMS